MAGQWREALHPRGTGGRFADVAALGHLKTDGQIDRAAARRAATATVPAARPTGPGGGWKSAPVDTSDFRPETFDRLAKGLGRKKVHLLFRMYVGRFLKRDVKAHIVKGNVHIYSRSDTVTPEQMRRTGDIIDKLQRTHPSPSKGPVRVFIDPQDKMIGGSIGQVYGLTLAGTPVIILSERTFDPKAHKAADNERFMPTAAKADPVEYIITHEWGHAIDANMAGMLNTDDTEKFHTAHKKDLSTYGKTIEGEGYAEAFTEWQLTKGRTANPAARAYAAKYGWKRPR